MKDELMDKPDNSDCRVDAIPPALTRLATRRLLPQDPRLKRPDLFLPGHMLHQHTKVLER